ncbi:MAG: hypothetical protein EPN30_01740 [Actinomycetota bacterium]|nr:MAG: hypothetical protein EPN30_01740 [Actinomycetota bacterium]
MPEDIGTQQWIDASNAILARLSGQSPEGANLELAIELKSDSGSSFFSLVIDNSGIRLDPGSSGGCSVGITIDSQLAAQINQGTSSIAEAISIGSVKIRGDVEQLVKSAEDLSRLSKSLSAIFTKRNLSFQEKPK